MQKNKNLKYKIKIIFQKQINLNNQLSNKE